jgi:hypothetical protein
MFAVPFIRMDHPLALSSGLVELLSKIAAGHTLLGDDASGCPKKDFGSGSDSAVARRPQ